MAIHIRSNGSQTLYGISGKFKVATAMASPVSATLHLSLAKIPLVTVESEFTVVNSGVFAQAGEFIFRSKNGYMGIVNIDQITAISTDPANSFAIPLTPVPQAEPPIFTFQTKPTGSEAE